MAKLQQFLPLEKENYNSIGLNEMFRFYRYTTGQRFKMHRDGSFKRNEIERSFYTFMIYLNDDFCTMFIINCFNFQDYFKFLYPLI